MSFKFGDMVRNDWAGDPNPHKVGMFIYYTTRKSGPFSKTRFAVFAKDGDKWEHDASDEKLVVTGNLFDDVARLREEIAMLRDKIKELEKLGADLIIQATCAEEKGARSGILATWRWISNQGTKQCVCESCETTFTKYIMQLWREGRGK